ncbi:hypothetical protein EGT67_05630 [Prescottella agglutinans]|uniref:Uncharacterized protein n=1 Tax=Prescottella agglutinans TaxID=1644129 RepID=A0A438BHS8_9NOCA|nr:hypothetical protein [Prescottella agglutinans]RVW10636.1 hypothetical protein EGT67_05630 [Prescottella agglutinans]
MNTSFVSRISRRKVAAAAVGLAATAAMAVPGVAWAQNAIPGGAPVAVATPAAQLTPASEGTAVDADGNNCAVSVQSLTAEELQKLIDDGVISTDPAVVGDGNVAVTISIAAETTEATPAEVVPQDRAAADTKDGAVTVTSTNC